LITTEDGDTAVFTVSLTSQPSSSVTIPVGSTDTSEGTVSTSSLIFDSNNWESGLTVTITGIDDQIVDFDVPYTITLGQASSSDLLYNGYDPEDVSVINLDNDIQKIYLPLTIK
jgi:hypothetical protein